MPYQKTSLAELVVSPENDRHGHVGSEREAINWFLAHRAIHIKALARDIIRTNRLFEPPLVRKVDGDKYVVHDGNRRVSTLKLLADPALADKAEDKTFLRNLLKSNSDFVLPAKLECQVESDVALIDEILYRRHMGTQGGIGQTPWDDRAKQNFEERTGKKEGVNVAELLEKHLHRIGTLNKSEKLPRSTVNRLLSSETWLNRVGLSVHNGDLFYTH